MTSFRRWLRFNSVGVLGAGVQLATLTFLSRRAGHHDLLTSSAAIEIAVLHNFVWHCCYTWRDRDDKAGIWLPLLRFHLSNGLVSLLGNALLLRALLRSMHRLRSVVLASGLHLSPGVHLGALAANGGAILCCSFVNFLVGDGWTFRAPLIPRSPVRASECQLYPRVAHEESLKGELSPWQRADSGRRTP